MMGKLFFAAAGAAAMYFADPQQGSARRARVRDRVESLRRTYDQRTQSARGGSAAETESATGATMIDLTQPGMAETAGAGRSTSTSAAQQASPLTSS
jgi:hypothetical protein